MSSQPMSVSLSGAILLDFSVFGAKTKECSWKEEELMFSAAFSLSRILTPWFLFALVTLW
jgi:hypothetical protein